MMKQGGLSAELEKRDKFKFRLSKFNKIAEKNETIENSVKNSTVNL